MTLLIVDDEARIRDLIRKYAAFEDERLFAFACLRVPWNALFYWISNECGCSHFP